MARFAAKLFLTHAILLISDQVTFFVDLDSDFTAELIYTLSTELFGEDMNEELNVESGRIILLVNS